MASKQPDDIQDIVRRLTATSATKKKTDDIPEEFRADLSPETHGADLQWYKDNILPGFLTWVNTIDPVLFMYFVGYCHTAVSESVNSKKPAFIGNWGVYQQFGEETTPRSLLQLHKAISTKLRQFSRWKKHGRMEPGASQVPNGWNRPIQYLEAQLDKIIEAQKNPNSEIQNEANEIVVIPVTNDETRLANLAQHLKEFYLVAWGKLKVSEKGILPAGFPKVILLTTEPIHFPEFFRRYALYVDFDSFAGGSTSCHEMRKMDFPSYESYKKLQDSGFPATVMEQSVAASRPSSDVIPLLKSSLLRSTRGLEIIDTANQTVQTVGGMEYVKGWAQFNKSYLECEEYHRTERPRGLILVGPPGTGKSMAAKVIANELNWPCIDLKIGDLFGGLVGETETNAENAFKVLRHVQQAVVRIDEIEKSLGGAASSNKTDGGTLNRVVGKLLAFMEANDHECIIVATANDQKDVPGALMRSGRLDAIVFADVPTEEQRLAILQIHAEKKGLEFTPEQLAELSQSTNDWSGKEIADALMGRIQKHAAVSKKKSNSDYLEMAEKIIKEFVPIAKSKKAEFEKMREWAKENAVDSNKSFT